MTKPVFDVTPETMWNYLWQAKRYRGDGVDIIASDSLTNLKKEVKARRWRECWISISEGQLTYISKMRFRIIRDTNKKGIS